MKIFKLFIILFLLINCTEKKSEQIATDFDKILGKENSETLTYLLSEFENDFLKRQYPNLDTEKAYRKLLIELSNGKTEGWKELSKKSMERFKSSNLRLEIYDFPDSVWIAKADSLKGKEDSLKAINEHYSTYIKSRYRYNKPDGSFEYTYSESYPMIPIKPNANFDSIIKSNLELPEVSYVGKYFKAIESVKNKNEFFKEFYYWKSNGIGIPPQRILAKMMLQLKADLTDPLVRKIIVIELVY